MFMKGHSRSSAAIVAGFALLAVFSRTSGYAAPTEQPRSILSIGHVQGVVGSGADGRRHVSPYNGRTVVVQGVVFELLWDVSRQGQDLRSFLIQNTAAHVDGDPNSSDGIYVFMGSHATLKGTQDYRPKVGDEIVVRGRVTEYYQMTEMTGPELVRVVRRGVDVDSELPAVIVNPPANAAEAARYWERLEGMRVAVPAGAIVCGPRYIPRGSSNAEIWAIHPDVAVAKRPDSFARRPFRDFHPLDNRPGQPDGNGYRILLSSMGIKTASGDRKAMIAPARTFDRLARAAVGGVCYGWGEWTVQPEKQIELRHAADPSQNHRPHPVDPASEFSVATFNIENLYDFRDDPYDDCDFAGNRGRGSIRPPFDYVPASERAYRAHLRALALQIIRDLHSPDVILIQEAEDQDIAKVEDGSLAPGRTDNADGKPDVLQELAFEIRSLGGHEYAAASDRDGADTRGITCGFLYRTDGVELMAPSKTDPLLGQKPHVKYAGRALGFNAHVQNPKALNAALGGKSPSSGGTDGPAVFSRTPQVGRFRIRRPRPGSAGKPVTLYAICNHFSSIPNTRVALRKEQAAYNAALVRAILAASPRALVIVGGDLNVFPRPEEPFMPGDPEYPSDQLAALYDVGLFNCFDAMQAQHPVAAYSYVYKGTAQTLDHLFVSPALKRRLVDARAAHVNADWPVAASSENPRRASDHDPVVARFLFTP